MPFPPFFRRLFGDNPVKPYKFRKELIPFDIEKFEQWYLQMESWRKSQIGQLTHWERATLPGDYISPDGSLVLFEDYPEFAEAYEDGAFNGMLLEATATDEDKQTWAGKWVKNAQGTGLYTPRLQGLFLRNAGDGLTVGQYHEAGLPGITGTIANPSSSLTFNFGGEWFSTNDSGALSSTARTINQAINAETWDGGQALERIDFDASNSNAEYGRADTVTPENTSILCGLYLGCPAEV